MAREGVEEARATAKMLGDGEFDPEEAVVFDPGEGEGEGFPTLTEGPEDDRERGGRAGAWGWGGVGRAGNGWVVVVNAMVEQRK